ncbi:MAG: hypothetical protein RLZZ557_390 [Bacteroidota bacterium]
MVKSARDSYNNAFTEEKYREFLAGIEKHFPGSLDFKIAETPVFVGKEMGQQMIETCEYIIDRVMAPDFLQLTDRAIPPGERVRQKETNCQFIAFDFGICENESGKLQPALIEMQGFPTLFGFQSFFPPLLEKHLPIPDGFSQFFNGLNREQYIHILRDTIIGDERPEHVILLEITPHEQKTRIDFYCTAELLNIPIVCISALITEGRNIYYKNNGVKTPVKRIYNRVIADELKRVNKEMTIDFDMTGDWDVEWIPHPNWFYRISKFTMPLLEHPLIPETRFLSDLKVLPTDLENFVLKPLFSFAGQGVVIDISPKDIASIQDPEHWILQRKMKYADCIETPDIPAKVEIRIMYIWERGSKRPIPVTNLARLSKGKMIGTRYNHNKSWVGGSIAYFEQ